MNTRTLLIGLTALILAGNAVAEKQTVRKWVDENGVTHYSTHAPSGVNSSTITANGGTAIPSSTTPNTPAAADKPKKQTFASANEPAYKVARTKNCEIAKQNIQVLMNSPVVTRKDSEGSEVKLTEEQRLSAIDNNKQVMADNCDQ